MAYSDVVLADSPAAYWRMGEASGQPQDSSGNGNHTTTTVGTPTYDATGAIRAAEDDGAITFGGAAAFTAPDSATLDLGDVFTLEMWIKRGTLGTIQTLLSKGTNGYYLSFLADNTIQLLIRLVGAIATTNVKISDTTSWNHFVATKNGLEANLYLNGGNCTGPVTLGTMQDTAVALHIAQLDDATARFNGSLDEIALYPTALSPARVFAHYEAGRPAITGIGASTLPRRFIRRGRKTVRY